MFPDLSTVMFKKKKFVWADAVVLSQRWLKVRLLNF